MRNNRRYIAVFLFTMLSVAMMSIVCFGEENSSADGSPNNVNGVAAQYDEVVPPNDDVVPPKPEEEPEAEVLNGLRKIDNDYFFYVNGKTIKEQWKKIEGKKYYFGKNGKAYKGLKTVKNKKFYFSQSGEMMVGAVKIGKHVYFFKDNGMNVKKGFIKWAGNKYYCSGKSGKLFKGYHSIGNKGYYFYKSGKKVCIMAKKTYIGHLWIPADGKLNSTYAKGIRILNKKGWTLRKAYNYAVATKYIDMGGLRSTYSFADYGFSTRRGNCYVQAAEFYVLAKLLGYDVKHVHGLVVGAWKFPHSWTEVKHNGKWWVYDPNFENLRTRDGNRVRSGYKIWYGKPGTWRYGTPKLLKR